MDLSVAHLQSWYQSMRDRWEKLNKVPPSGSGASRGSANWVRANFDFLRGNVVHQVRRRPVKSIAPHR